jgi:hypothetical protein
MGIAAESPHYLEEDAHIVRRLGWAVVKQWNHLSPEDRHLIKEQAVIVSDGNMTVRLNEQIEIFVERHAQRT